MKFMQAKREDREHRHDDDLDRLAVIATRFGVIVGRADLREAWESYSRDMAAGWMSLDEDDEVVWSRLSSYLEDA